MDCVVIVVGHQPQYLPHIGLFNKIAKGDKFVFVDNVQYNKKSWQNRTLLKGVNGNEILISIPVSTKGNYYQPIKDVKIVNSHALKKHLKTIELNYGKTVGYNDVILKIEKYYKAELKYLVDLTIPLMQEIMSILGIEIPIFVGSELGLDGSKTSLLVDICSKTKSDIYLSGKGAIDYFDESIFEKHNFHHYYNEYEHPTYRQSGVDFAKGISVIDMLFNEGIESSRKIFWNNVNERNEFKR